MSKKNIIIYSSTTGGMIVRKNTEAMSSIIGCILKSPPTIVYLDVQGEHKQMVWDESGKKGVYPLLFVDNKFIGDIEHINLLNDADKLHSLLGVK